MRIILSEHEPRGAFSDLLKMSPSISLFGMARPAVQEGLG